MSEFVPVGKLVDVGEGEMASFEAGGITIAVANLDGTLHAFDDVCTHAACSLAEGDVEETSVVCPCHGGEFDLETGDVIGGPPLDPIHVYEVRVRDGIIEVSID